jgi:methane/phenol/toluene hydroxylase
MRHLQDIVHLMFDLAGTREGFIDAGARDAWMTDPVLVPVRENIERIVSCRDWFEVVVAVSLVFEPIVGRLIKTEFLARNAPRHGDAVTPLDASEAIGSCLSRVLAGQLDLLAGLGLVGGVRAGRRRPGRPGQAGEGQRGRIAQDRTAFRRAGHPDAPGAPPRGGGSPQGGRRPGRRAA